MKPVSVALEIAQDFRFVADEETAMAEDDDSDEDLLVLTDALDLMALILKFLEVIFLLNTLGTCHNKYNCLQGVSAKILQD
jgi:hypothetical protein